MALSLLHGEISCLRAGVRVSNLLRAKVSTQASLMKTVELEELGALDPKQLIRDVWNAYQRVSSKFVASV